MKIWIRQLHALCMLSLHELYRRKDIWVVLVLGMLILLPLAQLKPYGIGGASRHLYEIALLLIWIFGAFIAIGVAGRQFPPEFDNRTFYPMMAKPVSRTTLLVGKYLGAWIAANLSLAIFYLLYGLFAGLKMNIWFPPVFCQAFILHVGFVTLVSALSILGSLCFSSAANLTMTSIVTAGMFFLGQRLPELAVGQSLPLRIIARLIDLIGPHVEFFDLRRRVIHEWGPVSISVTCSVLLYAVFYAAACLLLAGWILRRRKTC